jgi:hypothetical protein
MEMFMWNEKKKNERKRYFASNALLLCSDASAFFPLYCGSKYKKKAMILSILCVVILTISLVICLHRDSDMVLLCVGKMIAKTILGKCSVRERERGRNYWVIL